MQIWWKWLILAVISYLLGSVNPAIIVCRASLGCDIRTMGSGNAGSTNAFRVMGSRRALTVFACDILKTALAAAVGHLLIGSSDMNLASSGRLIGGIFAMIGHIFPVYYRFKGGKGVVALAVTMLIFDWRMFLIGVSVFLAVVLLTRYVSLGSMLGALSLPIQSAVFYPEKPFALMTVCFAALLTIFMHRANIIRLVRGTESKFSFKKTKSGT